MKTITITKSTVENAMREIDAIGELGQKERNCLRLLAEEMFSMIRELLKEDTLDFEISAVKNTYSLRASTKTRVGYNARTEFLSMSSDGKNVADRGVKGVLSGIIEMFVMSDNPDEQYAAWMCGMMPESETYAHLWTLNQFMATAPQEQAEKAWDGLEKSIIASFADDVLIGVRKGWLDMTVVKTFA